MENKNIKRINTIGKVSKIVVAIAQAVIICGIIGAILSGIAFLQIPEDFITVKGDVAAEVYIDADKAPMLVDLDADDIEALKGFDDIKQSFMGYFVDLAFEDLPNGALGIDVKAGAEEIDVHDFKIPIALATFGSVIVLGAVLVVAIFGYKLADAFSKCNSPFEENVIKRMKRFGYSLIPWALLYCLQSGSFSLAVLLFAIVTLLFILIFSYGAELQRENDDTI